MVSRQGGTFSLIIAFFFLAGCSRSETEDFPLDYGYDYFPLEVGRSYFYEVDSIIFDPAVGGTALDSSRTFVREDIVDTLLDNTGATLYRVERYERTADSLPWTIRKVLTLQRDLQKATRTEDNLRFTKLVFPVIENQRWDGNRYFDQYLLVNVAGEAMIMFEDWSYRITDVGAPLQMGSQLFDEVVTVSEADEERLTGRRYALSQYARGVGLVFRELWILDTQCNVCCAGDIDLCDNLPWEEKGEKGFILRQRLVDYH